MSVDVMPSLLTNRTSSTKNSSEQQQHMLGIRVAVMDKQSCAVMYCLSSGCLACACNVQ
jgi:hypothetical protein